MAQGTAMATFEDWDPQSWQEWHSPTVPVKLWTTAKRSFWVAVWRVVEAQLWNGLSTEEQYAAEQIADGFAIIARRLGMKVQNLEGVSSGRALSSGHRAAVLVYNYQLWRQKVIEERIDAQAVLAVLVEGHGCRAVDRSLRKRNGYTRQQLGEALAVYT